MSMLQVPLGRASAGQEGEAAEVQVQCLPLLKGRKFIANGRQAT